MNILSVLIAGFIISLASITGVLLVKSHPRVARFVETHLLHLSALSAGIFFVTSFSLGHETIESLGLKQSLIVFCVGFILFFGLQKILSTDHSHRNKQGHTHDHNKKSALKILIGDAIHNVADGLLLVASSGASMVHGISTAASIFIHEVPQEISEFIVLKKSGYSTTEAAYKNFATALSIFIGIAIGFAFFETEGLQAYLLGISASFFMGIIFTDLLPIKELFVQKKWYVSFGIFIIGILLMKGILLILPHHHNHTEKISKHNHIQEYENRDQQKDFKNHLYLKN